MIRVFIGTEPAQWLATEVLKHSILRRTKESVEFRELKNIPLKLHTKMYTGFSFYRFSIPEECQYEGRALYVDADIMVQCDLKELNEMEMGEHGALARPHDDNVGYFTSVMLMQCDKLKHWQIDKWVTLINAGIANYQYTLFGMPGSLSYKDFGPFASKWNDLDHWDENTKLIHYTNVPTQPWKVPGHPFAFVFLREMKSALENKVITPDDVKREIAAGHIYANILQDAENVK